MVIVVALTAISSFAIPQYSAGITFRMLRFIAMFSRSVWIIRCRSVFPFLLRPFSKVGEFWCCLCHSIVPYRVSDWKDFMIRMPLVKMKRRRKAIHRKDSIRKG